MKHVRDWGPGDYLKAGSGILVLAAVVNGLVLAYRHPPVADERLFHLEGITATMQAHEAHDDTIQLFNLCRESKTGIDIPERVAVAECLERYPTMLELGIMELRMMQDTSR